MNIQTVTLDTLTPSKANPRKGFEAKAIEGLAASIRTDGLLQNLVVEPKGQGYRIVSGERRYRALKLLAERGELPKGFAVPVEIRTGLSADDSLRIATVENLQRANLAPLEEMAALAKLVQKGVSLEDVAAQTGLSAATIKRRLALGGLCKEAKTALRDGGLTLAQAEAMTLGDHDTQRQILEQIEHGYGDCDPGQLREAILEGRPSVAMAIFPIERYAGSLTTDLFAQDETSYFDDAEQFMALQQEAVEALAESHLTNAAWVEVTNRYGIADWQYRDAEAGEPSGVLINLSPSGKVEVREGLAKYEIDEATAAETADNPLAPTKSTTSYAAPLRRYIAHHKSKAVQEVLLANPRKAKEVAAVRGLTNLAPHDCVTALEAEADSQGAYKVLEAQARLYADKLDLKPKRGKSVWTLFASHTLDECALYESVKTFTHHELDELHGLLAALAFGQSNCEVLDTADSLFNRVAQDLAADMANHWRPDRAFLDRRNRQQLIVVANECGFSDGRSLIGGWKKSELVTGLLRHFGDAHTAANPTPAQEKARAWLPEVMRFPAVDPDSMATA